VLCRNEEGEEEEGAEVGEASLSDGGEDVLVCGILWEICFYD
jgi:hypothetical protein